MVVCPVVTGTAHHLRLVPREIFEHRVHGVRRERRRMLAELLEDEQVDGRQFRIGLVAARAQHESTRRVERVVSAHVRSRLHGANERIDLRFRRGVITRAEHVDTPTGGEVAVEIQTGGVARLRHGEAVKVLEMPFGEQAVPRRTGACTRRRHGDHHARFVGVFLPCTVGIGDAHREDATVAVNVLGVQSGPTMSVAPRPRPHARAVVQRTIGQRVFDTVGIHPRRNVEGARLQRINDRRITCAEPRHQVVDDEQRRDATRHLYGMDVRIDPVRRLHVVAAGR